MKTPFLGAFAVSRSLNLADAQSINLFPETIETKNGKDVAALYLCPGLDLLATAGSGPIRGSHVMAGVLYVVSGNSVYSVTAGLLVTLLGTISTTTGPVSMIDNGAQLAIFDSANGYIVPGGFPLTGGGIGSGGTNYSVGDTINLANVGGTQNATAVLTVLTLSGSAVATFSVTAGGAFNPKATSFTQGATSGAGSGFTLTSPTYGSSAGVYMVPLPFTVPVSATFQDGFGVVNQSGTNAWFQSNLNDLSIWSALNFATSAAKPSAIVALGEIHREIWLFKTDSTEIWINAGLSGFVFQRLDGVFIEYGCVAPFSVAQAGESLIWLAQTTQGESSVRMSEGYQAKRISTHALEYAIAQYSVISDAIAYAYEQEGHTFYVLTFPTGNATWVYDTATGLWHQRAAFSNGVFNRHWGNSYAFFNGKPVIGDYLTGNLYVLNMNTLTDNGTQRKWLRSWRALPKPTNIPTRFSALSIDMQTGVGVPDGTSPNCMLRWSDDGGHRWSNPRVASVGKTGQTALRVKFNRLGSTKRNSGLDRIFELSSADQFATALIGADLE